MIKAKKDMSRGSGGQGLRCNQSLGETGKMDCGSGSICSIDENGSAIAISGINNS